MRKEDVLKLPSIPLAGPSYPAGPYRFIDREYMVISYETDPEVVRAQLPEPLEPSGQVVHFEWIKMPDSSGFGSYTESGLVIPARLNGEEVNFVSQMYLDDDPPIAAGREMGLVRGYDVQIAKQSSIVLPQSVTLFGGLALGLRPRRLSGDERIQLEVRGAWARLKGPVKQRSLGAPKVGTVSAPELDIVPVSADVTLRTGEPTEVALGTLEPGGPLTLTLAAWPID